MLHNQLWGQGMDCLLHSQYKCDVIIDSYPYGTSGLVKHKTIIKAPSNEID